VAPSCTMSHHVDQVHDIDMTVTIIMREVHNVYSVALRKGACCAKCVRLQLKEVQTWKIGTD